MKTATFALFEVDVFLLALVGNEWRQNKVTANKRQNKDKDFGFVVNCLVLVLSLGFDSITPVSASPSSLVYQHGHDRSVEDHKGARHRRRPPRILLRCFTVKTVENHNTIAITRQDKSHDKNNQHHETMAKTGHYRPSSCAIHAAPYSSTRAADKIR